MIIDHRTYTLAPGRTAEYVARYQEKGLPIQMRHLGRLVGWFVSDIGPLNQIVHIWAYDSITDREERRARMGADPEWQEFVKGNAGFFVAQENKIMKPAPFSPLR
jgi:NIPSNAP